MTAATARAKATAVQFGSFVNASRARQVTAETVALRLGHPEGIRDLLQSDHAGDAEREAFDDRGGHVLHVLPGPKQGERDEHHARHQPDGEHPGRPVLGDGWRHGTTVIAPVVRTPADSNHGHPRPARRR